MIYDHLTVTWSRDTRWVAPLQLEHVKFYWQRNPIFASLNFAAVYVCVRETAVVLGWILSTSTVTVSFDYAGDIVTYTKRCYAMCCLLLHVIY